MADRWKVRVCEDCGHIWDSQEDVCLRCATLLGGSFEVVRATGARSADPDTSKLAALAQEPRSGSQRATIREAVAKHGPMTAAQIGTRTGINGAWKRVAELVQGGHLVVVREEYDPQTKAEVQVYATPEQAEPAKETLW